MENQGMKLTKLSKVIGTALLAVALVGCADDGDDGAVGPAGPAGAAGAAGAAGTNGQDGVSVFVTRDDVIKTNANIAYAAYADSLITAQNLKMALETFVATPTEENFKAAKTSLVRLS